MANIIMRTNKTGGRVFRIRAKVNGITYQRTWPGKGEAPIPATWSEKKARAEAQRQAALFEDACRRGSVTNDKRTLSDYCSYVIDFKEATGVLKPRTIGSYRDLLHRIQAARLGNVRLADVTARDINTFYKELSADGQNERTGGKLSAATIKRYHEFLHGCMRQAVKEGIILYNPVSNATPPKIEHKEAAYFKPEQVADIIKALDHEQTFWRALTYTLIGTGARRGEVIALKWPDIDFNNCRINIHRNVTRTKDGQLVEGTPKTGRGRVISVPEQVIKQLAAWQKEQADILGALSISYCFALDDPRKPISPDSVTRWYARFAQRHNLPHINPHAFRHTQASIILQSGDIVAASSRLGHSRASTTTDIYGHMMNATDKQTAERIGAAFFNGI